MNKDDFSNSEDIKDAIGPIMSELTTDENLITGLCDKFHAILDGWVGL